VPRSLSVVPTTDPTGVRVLDDIQGVTTTVHTDDPVSLSPCSTDEFCFPVDTAFDLGVDRLSVRQQVTVVVRGHDAEVAAIGSNKETAAVTPDDDARRPLTAEVAAQQVKLYVGARDSLRTWVEDGTRVVATDGGGTLRVGIRSRHEYPEATVTTDPSPRSLMRAVSCLGSALKTDSPERSWPTLRGFPPFVDVVDERDGPHFDDPANLERTTGASDVHVEVYPTYEAIFGVASLAYYLAAPVVPLPRDARQRVASPGRLVVGDETYSLGTGSAHHERVTQVLQQVFTLDCITRTEGLYPIELHSRNEADARGLDLDYAALYDDPLVERLQSYLAVPWSSVADLVPRWKLTADVAPDPGHAEFLPFLVHELAEIRRPTRSDEDATPEPDESVDDFFRGPATGTLRGTVREGQSSDPAAGTVDDVPLVTTRPSESIQQLWIADGVPTGAAKPSLAAAERRLDARPSGDVRVAVVVNDDEMREEAAVRDLYGLRDLVSFDVEIHDQLTTDELEAQLAVDRDFVHYIGHVDERGLQCADGWLDARTLDSVGTRAFVLNACQSYEQGMALVEKGAIGGVVTLQVVPNGPAAQVGRTLANLLNAGFALGDALDIVGDETITGQQYIAVGDPLVSVAGGKAINPLMAEIRKQDSERYSISVHNYPSAVSSLGSITTPHIGDNTCQYLSSGFLDEFTADADELSEFLTLERFPVDVDGRIHWSDWLSLDDLR
jgi:hypothetical protein